MDSNFVLAIDVGGTSVKIGVVKDNNVLESTSVRNSFKGKSEHLLLGIKEICEQYIEKYNLCKIGIGCPGDICNGVVIFASNLGWRNFNILNEFKSAFPNCDIFVDNDGNAACQAEIEYGQLNGVSNGLFVTIGRGVGGAVIINNHLVHGVNNLGGRFGHMVMQTNHGRRCNCGRNGCFETYASVLGLIQTVKEYVIKNKMEDNVDLEKLSGFQIVQQCKNNNLVVKKAVKKWHNDIAEGLLNLCYVFDPSIIVIAGGITESELLDLKYIEIYLSKYGYRDCKVKIATFKGKTGLVGAAALTK